MNIAQRPSPNINQGRRVTYPPDMIVNHITEGAFAGAVSWLTNPSSQASAHFVVARDGRIVQLAAIENTAWANGTINDGGNRCNSHSVLPLVRERRANANAYTISIEHEGFFNQTQGALPPAQLEATIWLHQHIRDEVRRIWGIDIPINRQHIVGHHEITPRTRPNCPGRQFPFDEIIRRLSIVPNYEPQRRMFTVHWPAAVTQIPVDAVIEGRQLTTIPEGPEGQPQPDVLIRSFFNHAGFDFDWDSESNSAINLRVREPS